MRFKGRKVVITGAAGVYGRELAAGFAQEGATLLLSDRNAEALAAAVPPGLPTERVSLLAADLAGDEDIDRLVAAATAGGAPDVLVNNAGIYPQVPMLQMERETFERVQSINLLGLAFISQAVGQRMVEQEQGGKIVNIASIDSLHPSMVGLAAYDASKGGVLMFTRSFALEMAPHGVQVNAIAPGGIDTEGTQIPLEGSGMTQEQMDALKQGFVDRIPAHRFGDPEDIADATVFLSSHAADYVTGAMLVVDGGMLLT